MIALIIFIILLILFISPLAISFPSMNRRSGIADFLIILGIISLIYFLLKTIGLWEEQK